MGMTPKYETPEEFEAAVQAYAEYCEAGEPFELYDRKRQTVHSINRKIPMTLADMAYFLGFESRQSLIDYSEKLQFSFTVARAKLMVERDLVRRALNGDSDSKVSVLLLSSNYGYTLKTDLGEAIQGISDVLKAIHKGTSPKRLKPANPPAIEHKKGSK